MSCIQAAPAACIGSPISSACCRALGPSLEPCSHCLHACGPQLSPDTGKGVGADLQERLKVCMHVQRETECSMCSAQAR